MKRLFRCICIPLLHINNNVYTFLSGISISLATNIFTTICIDNITLANQWNLYVSTIAFALVSALLLFISSKIAGIQNLMFNPANNFDKTWREKILLEATEDEDKIWLIRFIALLLFLVVGIIFLATNVT